MAIQAVVAIMRIVFIFLRFWQNYDFGGQKEFQARDPWPGQRGGNLFEVEQGRYCRVNLSDGRGLGLLPSAPGAYPWGLQGHPLAYHQTFMPSHACLGRP
jgi:hypothetical protein